MMLENNLIKICVFFYLLFQLSSAFYDDTSEEYLDEKSIERRFLESFFEKFRKPSTTVAPNVADDPFYILKIKCENNAVDVLCKKNKIDLYELVTKCENNKQKTEKVVKVCNEIVSIYCYVFMKQDRVTCLLTSHDEYIPGKQPTTTKPSVTSRTTPRPTTSTTTATTTKASTYPFNAIPNFTGTITEIPADTQLLKDIGTYCARIRSPDQNCNRLLLLLKDQFIKCEKKSMNDDECQTFKFKFCTAYPNFNCCTEVLQGQPCKNKKTNRRYYQEV